jgi:hypothetical protein
LSEKQISPPDFDLAPLSSYSTSILDQHPEEIRGFIIALATVYNDFKDTDWVYHQLNSNKPKDLKKIAPIEGQWNGMANFLIRQHVGILYEFFELLKRKRSLFGNAFIQDVELAMGSGYFIHWHNLKTVAFGEDKSSTTKEKRVWLVCMKIRDNVAYHYYGIKNYSEGFELYKKRYASDPKVHCSLGNSLERTRFYFADACTQSKILDLLENHQVTMADLLEQIPVLNSGLRSFLECALKLSSGEMKMNRDIKRDLKRKRSQIR